MHSEQLRSRDALKVRASIASQEQRGVRERPEIQLGPLHGNRRSSRTVSLRSAPEKILTVTRF